MTSDENFLDKHTFLGDGQPDTLEQRLEREVPEDSGDAVPFERQPDAVGELVAEPGDGDSEQDVLAQEAGSAREDAPAEQAAMHVTDLDAAPEEDFSVFVSDVDDEDDLDEDDEAIERDDSAGEFVFDSEQEDDSASESD